MSIVDPRLFGTETALILSADAYRREEPSFTDQAYGGTVALQRELVDRWTTRVGYTYRQHNGTDIDVDPTEVAVTDYFEGDVFAETTLDIRDSPIFPRRGLKTSVVVDANDPAFGADIQFVRFRFGISGYWSVTDKLVLAARSEQGLLWPGEASNRIPLQERFFNGGQNSVRSFEQSQIGPRDSDGTPVGGEFRNLFSLEARFRLIGTLEGAVFGDAGNIGSQVEDFGLSDMRYGIGGGLRLGLPIGPVRADVAWNPDRQPGDPSWTFHLSVGYPF
jgi:outer membrane protein assembly factor BamA